MRISSSQACQFCAFIVFLGWATPCHGSRYNPRSVGYLNSTSSTSSSVKSSSSSSSSSKISSDSTTIELLTESVIPLIKSTSSSSLTKSSSSLSKSSSTSLSSQHTTSSSSLASSSSLSKHSSSSLSSISGHSTSTASHNATGTSNGHHATITPPPVYNPWLKPWAIQSWGTTWPWGNQKLANNTCSQTTDTANPYGNCDVFAGTMHLSYFPPQSGNVSYPTTHWAPDLSTTMTSPSIYMVVNSVSASNSCGQLGPTYKSVVIAVHPSALSTIPPYADAAAKTRIGPTRVLTLSDIASGCPNNAGKAISGEYVVTHPVQGQSARCNPQVVWPTQLLPLGGPFWQGCWKKNQVYGIYDPPGSVPPVSGLFTTTPVNGPAQPAPTTPPVAPPQQTTPIPTPTPAPSQANTPAASPPPQAPASSPSAAPPVNPSVVPSDAPPAPPASSAPAASSDSGPLFINIEPSGIQIVGTDSSSTFFGVPTDAPQQPAQSPDPADPVPAATTANPAIAPVVPPASATANPAPAASNAPENPANPPAASQAPPAGQTAPGVTPPEGQTVPGVAPPVGQTAPGATPTGPGAAPMQAALPSSVVVGGQTANLGGAPITVDSSIVQLTPSGIVVHDQAGGPANTIAIPTQVVGQPQATPVVATIGNQVVTVSPIPAAPVTTNPAQANQVVGQPVPIATIDGEVVSAAPGASIVVVKGQTATVGGAPVTLAGSNAVATLSPSALIVQYPGGSASTYALPSTGAKATSVAATAGVAAAIATIGGEVVSASPGASTIVFKGQTATIGGAPITITGSNIVATLGPSALIVQYPGGIVSTYALPTSEAKATSPPGIPITVGGQVLSIAPGASSLVLGTQTLKIGGPAMTIAGNNVVSLSPAGLVVQLPGGGVKTLALTGGSYSALATAGPSSTNAVGGIIASIMGVPSPAPPVGASPSIPTSTASLVAKPSNGTAASTSIQSGAKATESVVTVAPGSAGTRISVRCTSIIPWLGAVIIFGVVW